MSELFMRDISLHVNTILSTNRNWGNLYAIPVDSDFYSILKYYLLVFSKKLRCHILAKYVQGKGVYGRNAFGTNIPL